MKRKNWNSLVNIAALIEIVLELHMNGNPANLDPVQIWADEQIGIATDLETGEKFT